MRAVVCLKQVVDSLTPASDLTLDVEAKKVRQAVAGPPVINGYDEQALEAALRLKEELGQLEIIALSLGENFNTDVMKRALAVGADQLVLLRDPSLDTWDGWYLATVLAAAIAKIGEVDLVLCGRQASDWDNAFVPLMLAQTLEMPCLTLARKLTVREQRIEIERVLPDGSQIMWSELPAVVTVTSELGPLRMPTARARLATARVQPRQMTLQELGIAEAPAPRVDIVDLAIPSVRRECHFIEAVDGAAAGRQLADLLWEDGIIRPGGGA